MWKQTAYSQTSDSHQESLDAALERDIELTCSRGTVLKRTQTEWTRCRFPPSVNRMDVLAFPLQRARRCS